MRHRLFIAINLPEDIKSKLLNFREKWDSLFTHRSLGKDGLVRWTKKDSLHLTLVFIGYVTEEEMYEICQITRKVVQKFKPFFINFERILYGPPHRPPRMIWLEGKASQELSQIKKELEDALVSSKKLRSFKPECRPFSPHITLARIKMENWSRLPEKPKIEEDFKVSMVVNSIEVMESELKRDGAEYTILESVPLE